MFGDDIMIAPIIFQKDNFTNMANKTIWLPPGFWVEYYSGELVKGDRLISKNFDLSEIPMYVKTNAIIPKK